MSPTSQEKPAARFPFVSANPADSGRVRELMEAELQAIQPMVKAIIRMRAHELDQDDASQQVLLTLFEHCLPAFDLARGTPLNTYLIACIYQRVRELKRAHRQQLRRDALIVDRPDPMSFADARIDQLVTTIVTAPERYLNASQARVVRAAHEHPHDSKRELAHRLGINPVSLSRVLRKARRAVVAIAREELVA